MASAPRIPDVTKLLLSGDPQQFQKYIDDGGDLKTPVRDRTRPSDKRVQPTLLAAFYTHGFVEEMTPEKYKKIIDILLENGSDPNVVFEGDDTPLSQTIKEDSFDTLERVEQLLKMGALVAGRGYHGHPVRDATYSQRTGLLRVLLKAVGLRKTPELDRLFADVFERPDVGYMLLRHGGAKANSDLEARNGTIRNRASELVLHIALGKATYSELLEYLILNHRDDDPAPAKVYGKLRRDDWFRAVYEMIQDKVDLTPAIMKAYEENRLSEGMRRLLAAQFPAPENSHVDPIAELLEYIVLSDYTEIAYRMLIEGARLTRRVREALGAGKLSPIMKRTLEHYASGFDKKKNALAFWIIRGEENTDIRKMLSASASAHVEGGTRIRRNRRNRRISRKQRKN